MSRPPLEVADLLRAAGTAFLERNRHWLSWKHVKVLRAMAQCRTAGNGYMEVLYCCSQHMKIERTSIGGLE
jgi:hypothetical protein